MNLLFTLMKLVNLLYMNWNTYKFQQSYVPKSSQHTFAETCKLLPYCRLVALGAISSNLAALWHQESMESVTGRGAALSSDMVHLLVECYFNSIPGKFCFTLVNTKIYLPP